MIWSVESSERKVPLKTSVAIGIFIILPAVYFYFGLSFLEALFGALVFSWVIWINPGIRSSMRITLYKDRVEIESSRASVGSAAMIYPLKGIRKSEVDVTHNSWLGISTVTIARMDKTKRLEFYDRNTADEFACKLRSVLSK